MRHSVGTVGGEQGGMKSIECKETRKAIANVGVEMACPTDLNY